MQPNITNDERSFIGILDRLGITSDYDKDNTIARKYPDEFSQAIKNNAEMKKYSIPTCDLNDSQSLICGGNTLDSVEAKKGDKHVILHPYTMVDSDDAKIEVDNPNDKGVELYFWIEEEEIS